MADDSLLLSVLEFLRERGALGESSLTAAVAHADSFVVAVPEDCRTLLDLGSGGGLPGLVIASRLPQVHIVLTDRREHRTDLLRRACAQLGFDDRVSVRTGDVRDLGRLPALRETADVVTARAFGEPLWTLRCARPFLRPGGSVVVSEPPPAPPSGNRSVAGQGDERWSATAVARLGFIAAASESSRVSRFVRVVSLSSST